MYRSIILISILTLACVSRNRSQPSDHSSDEKVNIQDYAVMMGNTVLEKYPDLWSMDKYHSPHWAYTYGVVCSAMLDLWKYTDDQKYYNYAKAYIDSLVDENGQIKTYKKKDYNLDKINSGKLLFTFYEITGDQRYKTAMDTLWQQLREQPRTEIGGFWHKKIYPHQMWLDGLYMAGPFYCRYAVLFNKKESIDEVVRWFINTEKVTRDPETGLLYHGWDESRAQKWADPETGRSQNFWGRGMGWYAMALVDLLDYLPQDHPGYYEITGIISRLAEAVVRYQDDGTGVWYQVVDQGGREGNFLEGSVSAMFSYFLLKAVNKGYLDREIYFRPSEKAFRGMITNLVKIKEDGSLNITPVCAVAGLGGDPYRDGSYDYYIHEMQRDNDPKAVGPFIMAAIQFDKLTR